MVMHKSSNIPGFFALIIITLTFFVAIFAYYLAPDSSPYANEMHLELSLLEPQTEVVFIKIRTSNRKNFNKNQTICQKTKYMGKRANDRLAKL